MRKAAATRGFISLIAVLPLSMFGTLDTRAAAMSGSWAAVASMPTARYGLAAATAPDGRIFAFGGVNGGVALSTVEAYDPRTNTWTAAASMPTARGYLAAATGPDGRIYVMGGHSQTLPATSIVEAYDPSTNTWHAVPSMPTARWELAAATGPDGRIYAMGGLTGSSAAVDAVEAFDPGTNSWSSVAALPFARWHLAGTAAASWVYAIGGRPGPANVDAYKPATNGWTSAASLPTGRDGLGAATGPDGFIYAIGGSTPTMVVNNVDAYDGRNNTWSAAPGLPVAKSDLAVTTGYDDRIYAVGGSPGPTAAYAYSLDLKRRAVLPALANAAYGGYTSVIYIENLSNAAAKVQILYRDATGALTGSGDSATLPTHATLTVRQDNGHSFSPGEAGSGVVLSDQPVSAFVNEFAPNSVGDATSYTGINIDSGTGTTLFAPAIANNAYGGYTTGIGLINLSVVASQLTITYRDAAGSVVKTQNLGSVPAGAYRDAYSGDAALGLPSGFAGTATITSGAGPVAAIVNETGPGGQFSSYDAVSTGSAGLNAPVALNNAYGGYNTGIGIQNTTPTAGTVRVSYYDSSGVPAGSKAFAIAAHGYLGIYQGTDIPISGAYTATIDSSLSVAAIVNEVAPAVGAAQQSTAYNTFATGAFEVSLPLVESAGSDGWSTGLGIMNSSAISELVYVRYYDTVTGNQIGPTQSQTLAPRAYWGLYQPTGGLPSGTRASAAVFVAVFDPYARERVVVICNESNLSSFMSYDGQTLY